MVNNNYYLFFYYQIMPDQIHSIQISAVFEMQRIYPYKVNKKNFFL